MVKKNSTVENPVTGARGLGAHLILTKTKLPSHWIEGEPRADVYLRFTTLVVLGFWMCLLMSSTKQNAEKPKSETTHRFRVCGVGWGGGIPRLISTPGLRESPHELLLDCDKSPRRTKHPKHAEQKLSAG